MTAAATLLASQDVLGIERTADLMSTLLGVEVSTGFISSCLTRLDTALTAAGFEQALKTALGRQEVLGTDETPAPLTDAGSEPDCHNPHVYTVRTMGAYTRGGADLVWYGAAGDRTKASISGFGILDDFRGVLVRDDFGGYLSYDQDLAGVQQCLAHMIRYLDDAYAIDTDAQAWAKQVADALHVAIHEVNTARAADRTAVETELLTRLRRRFDHGVAVGISTNLSRPWPKGNHPGPGFRSYPVIWCTVGIVYAGQRLITWSNSPKSLVTRPVGRGLLELRGLRYPLVTWQHRPQKASQVGPAWRLSAISASGAGAMAALAATTPAAASPVKKPGSPLLL